MTYIICYIIFRHATDKDILLYVAAVNTPMQKETEDFINSFPGSDYAIPGADTTDSMDAFAAQGFLMPLESVFADDPQILDRLETGTVILEDNQIEVMLDKSVPYEAVTRSEKVYLDLSGMTTLPGMPDDRPVYIGIIANTPRQDMAVAFVRRIFAD